MEGFQSRKLRVKVAVTKFQVKGVWSQGFQSNGLRLLFEGSKYFK